MILLVSGEGPSDIGVCNNGLGICEGADFKPGFMMRLIDQLITPIWYDRSPLETNACRFISETELETKCKKFKFRVLPGLKKPRGSGKFFRNARGLAVLAKEMEQRDNCEVAAILCRDCDGANSTPNTSWEEKVTSMKDGFSAEDYVRGVPMVAKPKSEAWLLCAVQPTPYQNCKRFEEISGNDKSKNPAKKQLDKALADRNATQSDLFDRQPVDATRIDMPSFNAFRDRLTEVARKMAGLPPLPTI